VIYTFFVVLIALVLGGGLLYLYGTMLDELVTAMELSFPTIFTGTNWNIFKAFINWRTLLIVLIPTLIWVYSNNQGPEEP